MEDLSKVSSLQLYTFWKNLSIGLLIIVALMAFSILLPFYFSPIVALAAAAYTYTLLYNGRTSKQMNCMVVTYAIFFCLIVYSFFSIILNILYIWNIIWIPQELTFFSYPYIISLILCPLCFITILYFYIRRKRLSFCIDCKLQYGDMSERGKLSRLLTYESHFQLRNMLLLFGLLSIAVWAYYLFVYVDTDVNHRDWYVFVWLTIIAFVLDEFYFMSRYYNLYLDLKENNEIISQDELRDMTAKTYIRYYLVCGEYVYMTDKAEDHKRQGKVVIDTPFFTKRSVNGITISEVSEIIREQTGIKEGELRFFFGRKMRELDNRHSLLRYFYYLKGTPEDYPELKEEGEWIKFDQLKRLYSFHPDKLSNICVADITRMATIILTQKTFNENGYRKNKLKSYRPTFTLTEVHHGNYDFQDDKWIRISLFNSDVKMYRFKKWFKSLTGASREKKANEWN